MTTHTKLARSLVLLFAAALVAIPFQEARALIIGGEGNKPIRDPGWPKGAAVLINKEARIAYWEGPPFGGGQWHAECRGDATVLSGVLADFAVLDVKNKRVVLHDGVGQSFWLNMNNEPAKRDRAKMDWMVMIWEPARWQRLRQLPADLNPTDLNNADGPPAQIDVYTGGNVKWADVLVPKGLKIVDLRLEAHGFTPADGVVLEGTVTDMATKTPIAAAVRIERVDAQVKGDRKVAEVVADAKGHWVLKKVPSGSHRVVIAAPGFVPRVAGHVHVEDQPRWASYDIALARAAPVAGRVTDDAGQPLADVEVSIRDVVTAHGRYESPHGYTVKTGKDGRFRAGHVPVGRATIWLHKPGYVRPGLGQSITTPTADVELKMAKSARVIVTVDFTAVARPGGYLVHMQPEGGNKVGTFGGSGNINDKNQTTFDHVPPGRYVFRGQPNPGSADQQTDAVTIELRGGETVNLTLIAK
jgi:hypothetical protein